MVGGKKLDLQALRKLTNIGELMREPPLPDTETQALVIHVIEPKRSTTDPFEVNFATVDIVEGFDRPTSPFVRWFAWIFLGLPSIVATLAVAWDAAFTGVPLVGFWDHALAWFAVLASGLMSLLWPYVLLREPRKP